MASCKRKRLTLHEKIEILQFCDVHPGNGVCGVAAKFGVGKTQVSAILKDKDVLHEMWVANGNENQKWKKR